MKRIVPPSPVFPRSPPFETSGMQYIPAGEETGFPYSPVNHETVIYVRSPGLASDPTAKPWEVPAGSDETGNGTKAKPLATVDGVFKKFGRRASEGERFLVKFAGGITEAQALEAVDPWDGQCTSLRQYTTRGLVVSSGEAYVNSFRFEGPLLGALTLQQPNIFGVSTDMDGRTKFRFSGTPPPVGTMIRIRRGGVHVSFQPVIDEVVLDEGESALGYLITGQGNYYHGYAYRNTDTFDCITRAAELVPTSQDDDTGVAGADGIALFGTGAANMRGRRINDRNPAATFTMLGAENLNLINCHVSFDRFFFYHSFNLFHSSVELRGCVFDGQAAVVSVNSQVNVPAIEISGEAAQNTGHATVDGGSYAPEVVPPTPGADPLYPAIGGVDLTLINAQSGGLQIRGGQWNVRKGLSVRGGIKVMGGKFMMPDNSYPVHIYNVDAPAAALHVSDDGLAVIDTRNVNFHGVDEHLRVGLADSESIQMGTEGAGEPGTFREVAGWNGNFSHRLEVNAGGKPTGDLSAIRDAAVWGAAP